MEVLHPEGVPEGSIFSPLLPTETARYGKSETPEGEGDMVRRVSFPGCGNPFFAGHFLFLLNKYEINYPICFKITKLLFEKLL
jgi:hypothetical protein